MCSPKPHVLKPVPVTIITGFLGSGKTTTILEILKSAGSNHQTAVMINEWGKVALDGSIVSNEYPELTLREICGGCICCSSGSELDQAITEIFDQVMPDRIIIEPSGVAKPGEIIDLLNPHVQNGRLIIRPVICLVDPSRFVRMRWEDMPVYRDQIESAPILVANRCDLVEPHTLKAFFAKASQLYPPKLAIHATSFGRLPLSVLEAIPAEMPFDIPVSNLGTKHPFASHDKQTFTQAGWTWPPEIVFSESKLKSFFHAATQKTNLFIERAKAVFHTDMGWFLLEIAGGVVHQRPIQYRTLSGCQFIADKQAEQDLLMLKTVIESCIQTDDSPYCDTCNSTLNDSRRIAGTETHLNVKKGG